MNKMGRILIALIMLAITTAAPGISTRDKRSIYSYSQQYGSLPMAASFSYAVSPYTAAQLQSLPIQSLLQGTLPFVATHSHQQAFAASQLDPAASYHVPVPVVRSPQIRYVAIPLIKEEKKRKPIPRRTRSRRKRRRPKVYRPTILRVTRVKG